MRRFTEVGGIERFFVALRFQLFRVTLRNIQLNLLNPLCLGFVKSVKTHQPLLVCLQQREKQIFLEIEILLLRKLSEIL